MSSCTTAGGTARPPVPPGRTPWTCSRMIWQTCWTRGGGTGPSWAGRPWAGRPGTAPAQAANTHTVPEWLREPAPPQSPRPAPLSPSAIFDEEIGGHAQPEASAVEREAALRRGRLVHRLLQSLPDIAPERRIDAAERYLAKSKDGAKFTAEQRADILRKVLAILDDKTFAEMFAPGSRAEVPIVGRLTRDDAQPILVSGQVDRLAITEDAVLIADYKSDRSIPADLDEVEPYVAQLALYRGVLARLYPDKTVRAALVFTVPAGTRIADWQCWHFTRRPRTSSGTDRILRHLKFGQINCTCILPPHRRSSAPP